MRNTKSLSLRLISLMVVLLLKQGSTVPLGQEDLVCYDQFKSAVSVLVISEVLDKLAEINRLLDTCDSAVFDDCCQIKMFFSKSETGIYRIRDPCAGNNTFNSAKIFTRCDMETDGGGWIVIQRRKASLGTVNFTRNWEDYVNGFGDLDGEYWIGLNNIYQLTNQQEVDLQISVWNDSETSITWNYPTFRISGPENKYRLTVSGGTGDGYRDAFAYNNGHNFTTYDSDNDAYNDHNCGYYNQAGWWYRSCSWANLNGRHQASGLPGVSQLGERLIWLNRTWGVYTNSVMMIRSKTCGLG